MEACYTTASLRAVPHTVLPYHSKSHLRVHGVVEECVQDKDGESYAVAPARASMSFPLGLTPRHEANTHNQYRVAEKMLRSTYRERTLFGNVQEDYLAHTLGQNKHQ